MNTEDAQRILQELDRLEACADAVDDIRAALREANKHDPGWFDRWLRSRAKAARRKEAVNHGGPVVNQSIK
jgi:hypothetical protein